MANNIDKNTEKEPKEITFKPLLVSENLDMKINEFSMINGIENVENEQTWREFIRESEEEFGMKPEMIDAMTESDLLSYIDFLDELWMK